MGGGGREGRRQSAFELVSAAAFHEDCTAETIDSVGDVREIGGNRHGRGLIAPLQRSGEHFGRVVSDRHHFVSGTQRQRTAQLAMMVGREWSQLLHAAEHEKTG